VTRRHGRTEATGNWCALQCFYFWLAKQALQLNKCLASRSQRRARALSHLGGPLDVNDAPERVELGAQAAVRAENLFADHRRHRHAVEAVAENAPQTHVVAPLALVKET